MARELSFRAEHVPAVGYRAYRLQPRCAQPAFASGVSASTTTLENDCYRLEIDAQAGVVCSLLDKETGRELVDARARHPFGALLVRDPFGSEYLSECRKSIAGHAAPLSASLRVISAAQGYPRCETTYTLYAGEKRLDMAVHLLKDPSPLLEAYLCFPFNLPNGRFRYEGPLCIIDPCTDLLPGAYADRLTVQNWVAVTDERQSVLWSSREAPVVSLAQLWPGRVSPAHSAVVRADIEHPQPSSAALRGGSIYSLLTANNFGTNFAVAQSGELLFRYSITSLPGAVSDSQAVCRAKHFHTPLPTIFTAGAGPDELPAHDSFLQIDNPSIQLLALKCAEDGRGLILRLWNTGTEAAFTTITLPALSLTGAVVTDLAEEDTPARPLCGAHSVELTLAPLAIATVRLLYQGAADHESVD